MSDLVAANTGVGATSVKSGQSFMDFTQTIIQGYLTGEIIKRQNPQQAQYAEWGGLTSADRTQTTQNTASNQIQQRVSSGINPTYLILGGAVVVGLLIWFKK